MLNSREAPPAVVALERNDETYNGPGPSTHHGRASRERQSHEISLQNANKHKWAALRFRSWAPSPKSLPVFFEGQKISGQVELDLPKPESIKSINLSVRHLFHIISSLLISGVPYDR